MKRFQKNLKKLGKILKKLLTNKKWCGIILDVDGTDARCEKSSKIFLRNFQKGLDKRKRLWYNIKVAARTTMGA